MSNSFTAPALTQEEFQQAADAMAQEFAAVLTGRTLRTTVVLQALMQVYRFAANQLPPDTKADIYMAMATYAAEQAHMAACQSPQITH